MMHQRRRPRLGEPAGGRLYPVHSAAVVSEHFKTHRQIAETLFSFVTFPESGLYMD